MRTKRVIEALKNWSPKGLCDGVLVDQNGERRKTEACAVGCMALEFLTSDEGKAFLKKEGTSRKEYVSGALYGNSNIHGTFEEAVLKYYDMEPEDLSAIMSYNDNFDTVESVSAQRAPNLPRDVCRTIGRLRKLYVDKH